MSKHHGHHHAQHHKAQNRAHAADIPGDAPSEPAYAQSLMQMGSQHMERMLALPLHMFDLMTAPMTVWLEAMQADTTRDEPHVGKFETDSDYIYRIQLAGIVAEQLSLRFHDDMLLLHVRETDATERVRYTRPARSIRRALNLPVFINAEAISAEFNDGLLTIRMPKSQEPVAPSTTTIDIL